MKCPKCQFENPKEAKFCNECGHELRGAIEASPIDYSKPKSYTPKYRWSAHGVVVGKVWHDWQEREYVLKQFGNC